MLSVEEAKWLRVLAFPWVPRLDSPVFEALICFPQAQLRIVLSDDDPGSPRDTAGEVFHVFGYPMNALVLLAIWHASPHHKDVHTIDRWHVHVKVLLSDCHIYLPHLTLTRPVALGNRDCCHCTAACNIHSYSGNTLPHSRSFQ